LQSSKELEWLKDKELRVVPECACTECATLTDGELKNKPSPPRQKIEPTRTKQTAPKQKKAKVASKDLLGEGENDFDSDDSEAFAETKEARRIPRLPPGTKRMGGSARPVPISQHSKKTTQSDAPYICMCRQLNLCTEKDQPCRKICKADDRKCHCGMWMGTFNGGRLHAMTSRSGWNAWKCHKCKRIDAQKAKKENKAPFLSCISSCKLCVYRRNHSIDDSQGY
jgi:hypothetical protein